jgi:hypothetical protein
MKAETSKTKKWAAIVLCLVAIFLGVRALLPAGGGGTGSAPAATSAKAVAGVSAESLDPRLHLDLLANSESVTYEGEGKNIFRAAPEQVAIPAVKVSPLLPKGKQNQTAQNAAPAAPPPPPPPPPINLKFFGYSSKEGGKPQAFLAQGDDVWIAREGDVVNRQYKIVHITPSAVEVQDLLNNHTQSIQLSQG